MPYSLSPPLESVHLGPFTVPRIWTGLWQLSSNAWGSTTAANIRKGMARHVEMGYTAFGESYDLSLDAGRIMLIYEQRYGQLDSSTKLNVSY